MRIISAQFVKPYVKSNKSDIIDAAAIAEAATRPSMRFVEVKTPEQTDLQMLHRIRDQMMANRTRLINQMRAFCIEYGVALHQGAGKFKTDLPRALANELNDLTPPAADCWPTCSMIWPALSTASPRSPERSKRLPRATIVRAA